MPNQKPVDNSRISTSTIIKTWIITTMVFLLVAALIYAAGALPTTPAFPASDYYDVDEWAEVEDEQLEQLETGPLPVEQAKELVVSDGLPEIVLPAPTPTPGGDDDEE
jgi:hypothetical protein